MGLVDLLKLRDEQPILQAQADALAIATKKAKIDLEIAEKMQAWRQQNPWADGIPDEKAHSLALFQALNPELQPVDTPNPRGTVTLPGGFVINEPGADISGALPNVKPPQVPSIIKNQMMGITPAEEKTATLMGMLKDILAKRLGPQPDPATASGPQPSVGQMAANVDMGAGPTDPIDTEKLVFSLLGINPEQFYKKANWREVEAGGKPVSRAFDEQGNPMGLPDQPKFTGAPELKEEAREDGWIYQVKRDPQTGEVLGEQKLRPDPQSPMNQLVPADVAAKLGIPYGTKVGEVLVGPKPAGTATQGRPSLGKKPGLLPTPAEEAASVATARGNAENRVQFASPTESKGIVDAATGKPVQQTLTRQEISDGLKTGRFSKMEEPGSTETLAKLGILVGPSIEGLNELQRMLFDKSGKFIGQNVLREAELIPKSLEGITAKGLRLTGINKRGMAYAVARRAAIEIPGRLATGAVINPEEAASFVAIYTPLYGESGEKVAAKLSGLRDVYARLQRVTDPNLDLEANKTRLRSVILGAINAPPMGKATQSAPKVGDVVDGYKFNGGDPSKKENWTKAPSLKMKGK